MNMILKKIFFCLSLILFTINIFLPIGVIFDNYEVIYEGVPRVYLVGNIKDMTSKEDERKISINYVSSDVSFMKFAKIKIQGSSSIKYDKKNYTIKLYEDEEYSEKFKVDFGWGKENKYVLKANWIDKTHSRNIVGSNIVALASKKYNLFSDAPNYGNIDGYPVEVYINGEFLGLYTLNIPKDSWMLNMEEDNSNHLVFEAEISSNQTYFKEKAEYGDWSLQVGKENQKNLDKLNRVVDFVMNSSDEDFKNNFSNYFNLDSVLNYYVLADSLFLSDNYAKNMLLVSYDGEIWYFLLYDLDTAFGSGYNGKFLYNYDGKVEFYKSNFFTRFSTLFEAEIKDRYFELRSDILSIDNIYKEIDEFYFSIPKESLEKENDRWDDIPGYDIFQMKNFIGRRFLYLDKLYGEK